MINLFPMNLGPTADDPFGHPIGKFDALCLGGSTPKK